MRDSAKTFAGRGGWKTYGEFPAGFEGKTILKEPFGRITLRRGEAYIRSWWPGEYWYRKDWHKKDVGPYHGCSRRDRKDMVNWPLYEPHGWKTPRSVTYRHWGAGRIWYQPDFSKDSWRDAVVVGVGSVSDIGVSFCPARGDFVGRSGGSAAPGSAMCSVYMDVQLNARTPS